VVFLFLFFTFLFIRVPSQIIRNYIFAFFFISINFVSLYLLIGLGVRLVEFNATFNIYLF